MFTIIIAQNPYNTRPQMFQYTTMEGAIKMATLGYMETVHVFDQHMGHFATYINGQEVAC